MCEFCENNSYVKVELPEDNPYSKIDNCIVNMLYGGFIRVQSPDGRGFKNDRPIFQFDVLYCPFCGKKLKEETILSEL